MRARKGGRGWGERKKGLEAETTPGEGEININNYIQKRPIYIPYVIPCPEHSNCANLITFWAANRAILSQRFQLLPAPRCVHVCV